jgi:LPS sulfotransferase NodH
MSCNPNDILDRPVLVVGAPRSGTTWVQRLLLGHPTVRGGQESSFFTVFTPPLQVFHNNGSRHRFTGLDNYWTADALREEIRSLWRKTMQPMLKEDTRVLVEKSPDHAMCMDDIHYLLPEAKFIHVIRDSRAVSASLMAASKEQWGRGWTSGKPIDAAERWRRSVQSARNSGQKLGPQLYQEFFYEDLMSDPLPHVRRMFSFIGVDVAEGDLARIVEEQKFEKQKATGGTPFARAGELAQKGLTTIKEPAGFFRKGQSDSWKQELNLYQKLVIWRYTRRLMRECGYDYNGRAPQDPPRDSGNSTPTTNPVRASVA